MTFLEEALGPQAVNGALRAARRDRGELIAGVAGTVGLYTLVKIGLATAVEALALGVTLPIAWWLYNDIRRG